MRHADCAALPVIVYDGRAGQPVPPHRRIRSDITISMTRNAKTPSLMIWTSLFVNPGFDTSEGSYGLKIVTFFRWMRVYLLRCPDCRDAFSGGSLQYITLFSGVSATATRATAYRPAFSFLASLSCRYLAMFSEVGLFFEKAGSLLKSE